MSVEPPPTPMTDTPVEQLSYEEAYQELENIVAMLESGQHPLDTALKYYERGQALASRCAGLLENAELKLRLLSGEELEDYKPAA